MKKIKKHFISHGWIALFILLGFPLADSFANEVSPFVPHKGSVVLAFDVGPGASHFAKGNDELAILLGFKAGAGVSESLLLLLEFAGPVGLDDVSNIQEYLFSAQVFARPSLYFRGGTGLGKVQEKLQSGAKRINLGVGVLLASGYEWRLKKKFALSPEVQLGYVRAAGNNLYYGLVADFRWYF